MSTQVPASDITSPVTDPPAPSSAPSPPATTPAAGAAPRPRTVAEVLATARHAELLEVPADLDDGPGTGVQAAAAARQARPDLPVVVVAERPHSQHALDLVCSGRGGLAYVAASTPPTQRSAATRAAREGRCWIDPTVAGTRAGSPPGGLPDAAQDLLRMALQGADHATLADHLGRRPEVLSALVDDVLARAERRAVLSGDQDGRQVLRLVREVVRRA